ncbi:MAG: hypothetical protein QOH03_4559, partial [Kribbellaceae bacterium]|nr:hypothetical protein [Kribbellaceae bacterium]
MSTVFLVHGGLWEPMNAERFWRTPGIVAALETHGLTVVAPDRAESPASWTDDVAVLRKYLPQEPVVVVGASNGCSAAALLAVEYPELVERLV